MNKFISFGLLSISLMFTACGTPSTQSGNDIETNTEITDQKTTITTPITIEPMKTTPEKGDTIAKIVTTMGEINVIIYTNQTPETAKNFIEHANSGKYNNVPFHRVIKDFMIQTGDFENKNGTGGYSYKGPGTSLKDEFYPSLTHAYGAVSMANAGPNTGGSQFFIVQSKEGTSWLNQKHAIFGFVYEGMETVEKIASTQTDASDKPLTEITIESVKILTY